MRLPMEWSKWDFVLLKVGSLLRSVGDMRDLGERGVWFRVSRTWGV